MKGKNKGFFGCLRRGNKHRVVNIYDRQALIENFHKFEDWKMTDETLIDLAKRFQAHCTDEMDKNQFKSMMGVIGETYFASRMFDVIDTDQKGSINLGEYLDFNDIMMNGTDEQKKRQNFRMLDIKGKGEIDYTSFEEFIFNIIDMFHQTLSQKVETEKDSIKHKFYEISQGKEAITYQEYSKALEKNPRLFDWLERPKEIVNDIIKETKYEKETVDKILDLIYKYIQDTKEKVRKARRYNSKRRTSSVRSIDNSAHFADEQFVNSPFRKNNPFISKKKQSQKRQAYEESEDYDDGMDEGVPVSKHNNLDFFKEYLNKPAFNHLAPFRTPMNKGISMINETWRSQKFLTENNTSDFYDKSREKIEVDLRKHRFESSKNIKARSQNRAHYTPSRSKKKQKDKSFDISSRKEEIKECDSDQETEKYCDNSYRGFDEIDVGESRVTYAQEYSLISDVCDQIYDSLSELETNIRNCFLPPSKNEVSSFNKMRQSLLKRNERRKTMVINNVPHRKFSKAKGEPLGAKENRFIEEVKRNNKETVKLFDQDFDKVFNIMLGINRSVFWLFDSPYYKILDQDFTAKFEYNNQWYSQQGTNVRVFTFTDYAPKVFEEFRKIDGISNEDYAKALGPSNIFKYIWSNNLSTFKELCSTGKSGSLFYYTEDGKYMLKTIHKAEFTKMKAILKKYYIHLKECPNSVINRFYGLHKINYVENGKSREQYLVIMNNLFGHYEVDCRYDLKGSFTGRTTKFGPDEEPDKTIALKDNNFLENHEGFDIDQEVRKELLKSMRRASDFLGSCSILDYSTLVGIIDLKKRKDLYDSRLLDPEDPICELFKNNPKVSPHRGCFFSKDRERLFIVGIIDTLTNYTTKKKLEYRLKKIKYGHTMSCIPPKAYAERFYKFMRATVFPKTDESCSINSDEPLIKN
ncbi:unnamed protein product [Moneuplotes crassus]|uniref:Phosphatidylinositol-4-phosphate 5-kinase n=2 Tax=Euplotes crassus TaxID=5936 RepID=A0AAD1Y0V4_EUPCR|nr:unnamed protein product [Moneuplotes crassus]